ncbi:MAG: hypothetical protein KDA96_24635, partial [Planctomycetaceae bacterium]|nr:hypothetical protein [Planctomycetaceae bacterium]
MVISGVVRRALTLCLTVAMVSVAVAQPPQPPGGGRQRGGFGGPGGGPGGFGFGGRMGGFSFDRSTLLGSTQVREELKIADAQAVSVDAALEAMRDEQRNSRGNMDFEKIRQMSEEERTAFFEKMNKDREALSAKYDEMLAALLEPAQLERLDQIVLQQQLNRNLIETLKGDTLKLSLSEEQIAKLDAVEASAQEKRDALRPSFGGFGQNGGERPSREEMQAQMEKMRAECEKLQKETTEAAMAVLTADQTSKINTAKGKDFELDMRAMFQGRGQGGPGGGPGGRGGRPDGDNNGGGRGGRPGGGRP